MCNSRYGTGRNQIDDSSLRLRRRNERNSSAIFRESRPPPTGYPDSSRVELFPFRWLNFNAVEEKVSTEFSRLFRLLASRRHRGNAIRREGNNARESRSLSLRSGRCSNYFHGEKCNRFRASLALILPDSRNIRLSLSLSLGSP